jgi:hypothetical protein
VSGRVGEEVLVCACARQQRPVLVSVFPSRAAPERSCPSPDPEGVGLGFRFQG